MAACCGAPPTRAVIRLRPVSWRAAGAVSADPGSVAYMFRHGGWAYWWCRHYQHLGYPFVYRSGHLRRSWGPRDALWPAAGGTDRRDMGCPNSCCGDDSETPGGGCTAEPFALWRWPGHRFGGGWAGHGGGDAWRCRATRRWPTGSLCCGLAHGTALQARPPHGSVADMEEAARASEARDAPFWKVMEEPPLSPDFCMEGEVPPVHIVGRLQPRRPQAWRSRGAWDPCRRQLPQQKGATRG